MKRRRDSICIALLSLATPVAAFQQPATFPSRPTTTGQGFALRPLAMSAPPPVKPVQAAAGSARPLIEVALDRPLISDTLVTETVKKSGPNIVQRAWRSLVALASGISGGSKLLSSNVVRGALLAFVVAFLATMIFRTSSDGLGGGVSTFFKTVKGRIERLMDGVRPSEDGVLMPFEEASEGWGVSTLKSRKRLGKTNFIQYEFELPQPDYVLPLELGQQVSLCCLDNEGNVARGDFFPFSLTAKTKPGSFSILVPNKSPEENMVLLGLEGSNFVRVVKQELKIGDEVAVKPGDTRLTYRGQYLPVTDIVYIACGNGIVPVIEQVRAVLPRGSSSVGAATVIWINEETKDFDILAEVLEKEYFKYSDKLAVSCIVDSPRRRDWSDNNEINSAVPDFKQGTMAVLSGPTDLMEKAFYYLEDRGYPSDTICVL